MKTLKLFLERDNAFPSFNRLGWEFVDVSLEDVLERGVHPWAPQREPPSLVRAFLERLNAPEAKPAGLEAHAYDVAPPSNGYGRPGASRFETALHTVAETVFFVEAMSPKHLLDMAWERIQAQWSHPLAKRLLKGAVPGFNRMRAFLKQKDKRLKLTGYESLEAYDLSQSLSPEDFRHREQLILAEVFGRLNFRRTAWLGGVTDGRGRLRMTEKIHALTVSRTAGPPGAGVMTWNVGRREGCWRFKPSLAEDRGKRAVAEAFAKQWRVDRGRLCFNTSLERLQEMAACEADLTIAFPGLNYNGRPMESRSTARVRSSGLPAWRIGAIPSAAWTTKDLRALLHRHGRARAGNKERLLERLAEYAASLYERLAGELEGHLGRRRFIRIAAPPKEVQDFPAPRDVAPEIANLLLSVYALTHLRGNAILDPAHRNDSCIPRQLALALLRGKASVRGAFLRV